MRLSLNRLIAISILPPLILTLLVLTGCQTTSPEPVFQDYDPGARTTPVETQELTLGPIPTTSVESAEEESPVKSTGVFRVGDVVAVTFSGTAGEIPPHQERIKEDGTITLFLIGPVKAAGKTDGELQKELQEQYDKYYKTLVVTVSALQRFYYVGGEVKRPGAQPYLGETTVTGAIQSAGDFTDFAKKTSVRVIRADGTTLKVNFNKAIDEPSLDPPIYPGDKIHVPRRILW